jgi:hypothetical protein
MPHLTFRQIAEMTGGALVQGGDVAIDSVVIDSKECGRLDRGHSGVLARVRLGSGQNSAPGTSAAQTPGADNVARFCSDPRPPIPDTRSATCT